MLHETRLEIQTPLLRGGFLADLDYSLTACRPRLDLELQFPAVVSLDRPVAKELHKLHLLF